MDRITPHIAGWQYKGVCGEARLRDLKTSLPFEEIADRVEHDMQILCCHTPDCCDRPEYKRTVYCVEVTDSLFDVFFNSEFGYRGQYFDSPERGLSANLLVLRTVKARLVAWTQTHCADQDSEFATASLSAASAKVWFAEGALRLCERCVGEWDASLTAELEILNGRWECDLHTHAKWGRQAHRFRKLRFFGAFLNDAGEEYIAPHKKDRAADIWARGWA